jgi:hypothetical protein
MNLYWGSAGKVFKLDGRQQAVTVSGYYLWILGIICIPLKSQMRHFLVAYISIVTLFACKFKRATQPVKTTQSAQHEVDCPPGEDTINFVTTFTKDTAKIPTNRFYSIVSFVADKGLFKPTLSKTGDLKIERETSRTFHIVYDSCNMKRWITKNFIMKNMQVSTLGFTGTKKDRSARLTPGLHFEEWKFASNADRDSAMKIVQTVYTDPNNNVMYEKRYSQFIIDDERIFLLETGAKFAEPYAIEYRKLIERFIKNNNR